jgi:hypothetical protein
LPKLRKSAEKFAIKVSYSYRQEEEEEEGEETRERT